MSRLVVALGLPSVITPDRQEWWDHWLSPERVEKARIPGHVGCCTGWLYRCDGMPTLRGCGEETISTRRWKRVGAKSSGWTVVYGASAPGVEDRSFVTAFCPSCTEVVNAQ